MILGMVSTLELIEDTVLSSKCAFTNCGECVFCVDRKCMLAKIYETLGMVRKHQLDIMEG